MNKKSQRKVIPKIMLVAVSVILLLPILSDAAKPSGSQNLPYWAKKLPADNGDATGCNSSRFTCVLDGEAVLDNETGLVWERAPSTTGQVWSSSIYYCANLNVGGRKGWHLPTVEQLNSLVDTSVSGSPKLPSGHPFTIVQSYLDYWSTNTIADNTTEAYSLALTNGFVWKAYKTGYALAWCVRGGQSHDAY